MMNVKVYNQEGAEVGSVELKPEVFGLEPNEGVVHQYVVNYLARQRQGNASTKTRRDVRGGGKKPWRQKGTGHARSGTIRSPLWKGGGTVFGPHPHLFGYEMPKKLKKLAIRSVFSDKAQSDRIKVLEQLNLTEVKTKAIVTILSRFDLAGKKCVILDEGRNEKCVLSCNNLQKVKYLHAAVANGYDLLHADYIILTKAGLDKVHEVYG